MRTVTKVYKTWDELTEEEQERAFYLNGDRQYDFDDSDLMNTLNTFCATFGVIVTSYEYDALDYRYTFAVDDSKCTHDELPDFREWVKENCKVYDRFARTMVYADVVCENCLLTGYYADSDILKPVSDLIQGKDTDFTNYSALIDRCLELFFMECCREYEYHYSCEGFGGTATANNWEFDSETMELIS